MPILTPEDQNKARQIVAAIGSMAYAGRSLNSAENYIDTQRLLNKLKKQYPRGYNVIYYRYYLGQDIKQVAAHYKVSERTIQMWTKDAIQLLIELGE